jgi:hypothetical protein
MNITNNTSLPEPVFRSLTRSDYTKGNSNRSVTQLIDSPRVRILRKENADTITEDAADMVWSVLGTAVHKMFEENDVEGHISEERLYAEVDNWVISGAIDIQRAEDDGRVTVLDYKCTSAWSVIYGKIEWHRQLNFYAWLVEQTKDVKVSGLQIVAVLRDWQRKKAETDSTYPQAPILVVDIPLWSEKERHDYVTGCVTAHQNAEFERLTGGSLPLCADEQRWKKDDTFAVKKQGNKRAVRVFDSMEQAEAYMKDADNLEIEVRKGKPTRCEDNYCKVAHVCDQYQQEVNDA